MKTLLLWVFAVVLLCLSTMSESVYPHSYRHHRHSADHQSTNENPIDVFKLITQINLFYPQKQIKSLHEIKAMLHEDASQLSDEVIDKVLTILKCTRGRFVENNILTLIDYGLPSNKKRLWVFDLAQNKLLFNTYVGHGIKTGTLRSEYFSDHYNSKASSIGVYDTGKSYGGRHGVSLKLTGLDRGFNDNAEWRSLVMHGAWYVDEDFIKKYGRPGRSWGCPVVPQDAVNPIINAIKGDSLFLIYYPSNHWLATSKFLNCDNVPLIKNKITENNDPAESTEKSRDEIIFADLNHDGRRTESEPVVVISADNYQQLFKTEIPLDRMLRRRINHEEYIALSSVELNQLASNHSDKLEDIHFVVPVVIMRGGYFATEMKIRNLGKIKEIKSNIPSTQENKSPSLFTVYFEGNHTVNLKLDGNFIRWIGL